MGQMVSEEDGLDTQHTFCNDDRPEVFDPDASATAWARTLGLFRSRLR